MIILKVDIDNFYCFKDFKINFSYKKKLSNSLIENEFLEDYPNFRFKKVNLLMGCNASGKTAFGKMLMAIVNFIKYKRVDLLFNGITNNEKKALFKIDFAIRGKEFKYFLYSLEVEIKDNVVSQLYFDKISLNKRDSYESALKRMAQLNKNVILKNSQIRLKNENSTDLENNVNQVLTKEMTDILDQINSLGWFFCFPNQDATPLEFDPKVLEYILKTFDNSILSVKPVKNTKNGYLIQFNHGKNILIQDGKASAGNDILSSGTKEGVEIAYVITSMLKSSERPFYIDEKFSYSHTEIEKNIFSLLIDLIGKEDQLFFTTHNLDLLDMNLPLHSYTFFGKTNNRITPLYPENLFINKNDRNLRNLVLNDVFNTIPNVDALDTLRNYLLNK